MRPIRTSRALGAVADLLVIVPSVGWIVAYLRASKQTPIAPVPEWYWTLFLACLFLSFGLFIISTILRTKGK